MINHSSLTVERLIQPQRSRDLVPFQDETPFSMTVQNSRAVAELLHGSDQPSLADVRIHFEAGVLREQISALGQVAQRGDIPSTLAPFQFLPDYRIAYPDTVVQGFRDLFVEYNKAFSPLIEANREFDTDYQYCIATDGMPLNYFVQVDLVGLPESFLAEAGSYPPRVVRDVLRGAVFEVENSLAMVPFLTRIFEQPGQPSIFAAHFRAALDAVRQRFQRPLALLAITDEKYRAMCGAEFGQEDGAPTDEEVQHLSGFDTLLSPTAFRQHLAENEGKCRYLLYVRSSDPAAKLRNPAELVDHPLLRDPALRRCIRKNALTFNIDDPDSPYEQKINDTKEYQEALGMAFSMRDLADIFSAELLEVLQRGKGFADCAGAQFTRGFAEYLRAQGVDPTSDPQLRCKPMKGAYGCYGHLSGRCSDGKFRAAFRKNLRSRGPYVVQPERAVPTIVNTSDGVRYTYIDRVFLGSTGDRAQFLGGFRSLLPVTSNEAMSGRNHGSRETVFAEILPPFR